MDVGPAGSGALSADPPRRPRVVDVAIVLVLAAAAVNGLIGVLVAVQAAATRPAVPVGPVVVVVVISLAYAVALAVFALRFAAGRTRARGVIDGLASASLLTVFALNALNLTVILLLVAAVVLLHRRAVGEWARALRGLPPV